MRSTGHSSARLPARSAGGALLLLAAATQSLIAQAQAPGDSARRAREPLFTVRDAYVAAGFAAATVALLPLDRRVATRLQDSTTQANRFFDHSATGVELIASPGAYVIGGGLYAVGRLAHVPRAADLGLHGAEAVLLGDVITGVLKGSTGRARPFVTADTNPRDFRLGRGFTKGSKYTSFPSGHTTTAFAAASAVTSETSRWWPRSTWIVAPVMYGGATLVGLSRMYHNKHWASDVALGAGIGTFSGLKVVRYNHTHPGNRVDRWLLGPSVTPAADGSARLQWTVPWPREGP
ncbi:MAG: phosphatase PAP2 family protein [Gemmatimonadaceae bacterium]